MKLKESDILFLKLLRANRAAAMRYLEAIKVEMFDPDTLTKENVGERSEAWKYIKKYLYEPARLDSELVPGKDTDAEEDYG